jgi:hypothetical protein
LFVGILFGAEIVTTVFFLSSTGPKEEEKRVKNQFMGKGCSGKA